MSWSHVITDPAQLQDALGGPPDPMIEAVKQPALDTHARAFLALSPFYLISTHGADGRADVSPRGDAPGFALVLDDRRLVIPERLGNRLADSLRNIMQTGQIGMLFLVPGFGESMRINGRAQVIADPELMERMAFNGRVPKVGIAVEIEEVFVHCARCMLRSGLWTNAARRDRKEWISLAGLMIAQQETGMTLDEMQEVVDDDYRTLY